MNRPRRNSLWNDILWLVCAAPMLVLVTIFHLFHSEDPYWDK